VALADRRADRLGQRVEAFELQPRSGERALLELDTAGLAFNSSFDAVALFDLVACEGADLNSETHAYAGIL
jgi:hypothetical protein